MALLPFAAAGGASSPLTTKGDIWGFGTTNSRIPVGTNGYLLMADSTQTLGVGYSTANANFDDNAALNIWFILIGESSSTNNVGLEIATNTAYFLTAGAFYYGINLIDTISFSTVTPGSPLAMINVASKWTVSKANTAGSILGMALNPTLSVTATWLSSTMLQIAPTLSFGTLTNLNGISLAPSLSAGTISALTLLSVGLSNSGATVTTLVGFKLFASSPGTATTTWAMQVGAYNSYLSGLTTFGGTATPAYAVHIQGGNSATLAYMAINSSTTAPTAPSTALLSGGAVAMGIYRGSGGTNTYLLLAFDDAGTTRYKYLELNSTGTTWAQGTSLPT